MYTNLRVCECVGLASQPMPFSSLHDAGHIVLYNRNPTDAQSHLTCLPFPRKNKGTRWRTFVNMTVLVASLIAVFLSRQKCMLLRPKRNTVA